MIIVQNACTWYDNMFLHTTPNQSTLILVVKVSEKEALSKGRAIIVEKVIRVAHMRSHAIKEHLASHKQEHYVHGADTTCL